MTQPLISVAMAVYNGEKYLSSQIESILSQFGADDELIVSLDPSNDLSESIILGYTAKDARVRLIKGPGEGPIRNFECALKNARGAYIFLADQDDIWAREKIAECLPLLQKENVSVVIHDAYVTDESLHVLRQSFFEGTFYSGIIKTIIKNRFIGCCMAFKRSLLDDALPFPNRLPMHDQWLGILAKSRGDVIFIDKPLLFYRRHGQTVTGQKRAGLVQRLRWRFNIALSYIVRRLFHGRN